MKYNLLAAANVFSGLILTLCMMSYFGSTAEVDKYFSTLVVIANINVLSGFFYFAFLQHYLNLKITFPEKADNIYWLTLLITIFFSITIVLSYKAISHLTIETDSIINNNFIRTYIIVLLLIPVFEINNFVINSNKYYALPYLLNIIINSTNVISIVTMHDLGIITLAYSTILAYILSIITQVIFIKKNSLIGYSSSFFSDIFYMKKIIRDSITIKLSSLINGTADLLIAYFLTSLNTGIYSIYSYARKFSLAIFNIANGPLIKKFNTDISLLIIEKNHGLIIEKGKKTLMHILPLLILGQIIVYYSTSVLLPFIDKNIDMQSIIIMQNIFIIMSIYYFFLTIEYMINTTIAQFHAFKYNLFINIVSATIFLMITLIVKNQNWDYTILLHSLTLTLIINISVSIIIIKNILFKERAV